MGGQPRFKELIAHLNTVLTGWVQYFRVGNASRAFSEIRDYVEMKVRILLTRRKRRHKRAWAGSGGVTSTSMVSWGCSGIGNSDRSKAQRRTSESHYQYRH